MACRILVPQLGTELGPPQWNGWVLPLDHQGMPGICYLENGGNLPPWPWLEIDVLPLLCWIPIRYWRLQNNETEPWLAKIRLALWSPFSVEDRMILTEVMVKVRLGQGLLELVDLNFDETWSEISSEGGHGNPLQYPCLENPTDRGTWWVTVHKVAKSQTQLKWLSAHIRESPGILFQNTMFH